MTTKLRGVIDDKGTESTGAEESHEEPARPDPERSADLLEFVRALAELRLVTGDTYKKLQVRTGVPHSTLYDTLTGKRRPRVDVLQQVVRAYAEDEEQAERWMRHWGRLVLAAERPPAPAQEAEVEDTSPAAVVEPDDRPSAVRRKALVGAVLVLVAAAAAGTSAMMLADGDEKAGPPPARTKVTLVVHNVDLACRPLRTLECSLNLVKDPRAVSSEANIAARSFHGDKLEAECVISDGRRIMDEQGMVTTRWYHVRVPDASAMGWLPGIRTRNSTEVPACPATDVKPATP